MFWQRCSVYSDILVKPYKTFPFSCLSISSNSWLHCSCFWSERVFDGPLGRWIKLYLSYLYAEINLSPFLLSFPYNGTFLLITLFSVILQGPPDNKKQQCYRTYAFTLYWTLLSTGPTLTLSKQSRPKRGNPRIVNCMKSEFDESAISLPFPLCS